MIRYGVIVWYPSGWNLTAIGISLLGSLTKDTARHGPFPIRDTTTSASAFLLPFPSALVVTLTYSFHCMESNMSATPTGAHPPEGKVVRRILAGTFAVVALLVAIGWMSLSNMQTMDVAERRLVEQGSEQLIEISEMETTFQQLRVASRDLLAANTREEDARFLRQVEAMRADLRESAEAFGKRTDLSPEVRAAHTRVTLALGLYFRQLDRVVSLELRDDETKGWALLHSEEYNTVTAEVTAALNGLTVRQVETLFRTADENRIMARTSLIRVG